MAKTRKNQSAKVVNRRAKFDYELGDSLVVGLLLTGSETKNLRFGHGQLRGSYVTVKGDELWLINATISGTNGMPIDESEQTRARKLLAKKREIDALIQAKQEGRTIVPLEILTRTRFIKLKIAIGKGKKHYDKRQVLKKRDDERAVARELRRH